MPPANAPTRQAAGLSPEAREALPLLLLGGGAALFFLLTKKAPPPPPPGPGAIPDGSLITYPEAGGHIWIVTGGTRREVTQAAATTCGYDFNAVTLYTQEAVLALPTGADVTGPPDCPYGNPPPPPPQAIANGTLVTYDGSGGRVWIVSEGKKREIKQRVTPGDTFLACGYDYFKIRNFPQAQVDAMPNGPDVVPPNDCPYGNPPPPPASGVCGDVDGDGRVTAIDAQLVQQHVAGLITLTPAQLKLADVNGDGHVTVVDAELILQKSAGLNVTLNCTPTAPPPPTQIPIPDGTLASYDGAGGRVWYIDRGSRREILSEALPGDIFAACGYSVGKVTTFPKDRVLAMPLSTDITGPPCPGGNTSWPAIPNGTLVSYNGANGRVWVIAVGKKREIVMASTPGDTFAACGYNVASVKTYPRGQVEAMPTGANVAPPNDCPYGNPPPPPTQIPIPDGVLCSYDGAGGRVWVIDQGKRREVLSVYAAGDVFAACGYSIGKIQTLPQARVLAMPVGTSITAPPCPGGNQTIPAIPNGQLVTYPGTGRVWIISLGRKREIIQQTTPGDTFAACGYNIANIRTYSELVVKAMPTGTMVVPPIDCPFGNPPPAPSPTSVCGDIDGDGKVTAIDVNLALNFVAGNITLTAEQQRRGDVDGDGRLTSVDASLIKQKTAGLPVTFHCR